MIGHKQVCVGALLGSLGFVATATGLGCDRPSSERVVHAGTLPTEEDYRRYDEESNALAIGQRP
ncbi:MAG: hypothetical protein AAGC97_08505 [Planctomycetota bacterium]